MYLFKEDEKNMSKSLKVLADYIRKEAFSIEKISDSDLLESRLTFGPAPKN